MSAILLLLHVNGNTQAFEHGFCYSDSDSIDYTPLSVAERSGQHAGPYTVKLYIHHCLHADGSGGLTPAETQQMLSTTISDYASHNIFFNICEITHYEKNQEFTKAEQESPESFWVGALREDGLNAFIFPSDYLYNDGCVPIFIAGGLALATDITPPNAPCVDKNVHIPSTALMIWGHVTNCFFPLAPANEYGRHFGTVPHALSHEIGHCLGLLHPHDRHICLETGPADCLDCGDQICETAPAPNLGYSINAGCQWVSSNFPAGCCAFCPPLTYNPDPAYNPDLDNIMAYTNYYNTGACAPRFVDEQGQRMRNYLETSALLQPIQHKVFSAGITITGNETWPRLDFPSSGNVIINGDLVVENGASLDIWSGRVQFSETSSLIIKPGGEVDNLGGILTAASCVQTWRGVDVLGNPNTAQSPQTHGRYFGNLTSRIEHAWTGLESIDGGILSCSFSDFRDNLLSVLIGYHNFPNQLTSIRGCDFVTDIHDRFISTSSFWPRTHLMLVGAQKKTNSIYPVHDFSNNRFRNTFNVQNPTNIGIWGISSSFLVRGNDFTYPPTDSYFENLSIGIYASTGASLILLDNNFANCNVGAYVSDFDLLFCNRNEVTLGGAPSFQWAYHLPEQFGVWMESDLPTFSFQDNNFSNVPSSGGQLIETIGSYAKNLGTVNKTIEDNYYAGVTYANLANYTNSDPSGQNGLYYLCNNNTGPQRYDFSVESGSIRNRQGVVSPPNVQAAANTFSYSNGNNGDDSDFYNNGNFLRYYYRTTPSEEPFDYTSNSIEKIFSESPSSCVGRKIFEDTTLTETEVNQLKAGYYAIKAQQQTTQSAYQSAVLTGDTTTAIQKETELVALRDTMDYLVGMVLVNDPGGRNNLDSLRKWMSNYDRPETEMRVARWYFNEGRYASADSVLQLAPQKFELTLQETDEIASLRSLMTLLNGKDIFALDSATIQTLLPFAADSVGHVSTWARNLLRPYGYWSSPVYILPEGTGERSTMEGYAVDGRKGTVMPNPADQSTTLDFAPLLHPGRILVSDFSGRLVLEKQVPAGTSTVEIRTAHLPAGLYTIRLSSNGQLLQTAKVAVQH